MNRAIEVETVYKGGLFSVEVLRHDDQHGNTHAREVVRHPGAVMVVPMLEDGRLVMIRNYRIATDQTLWEFPAGKLSAGEEPAAAARRELSEETGYTATGITALGEFYTSPGFADELMRTFVAKGLQSGNQNLEPGEEIEVRLLTPEEVFRMLSDGSLRDGKSIAGLFMYLNQAGRLKHALTEEPG